MRLKENQGIKVLRRNHEDNFTLVSCHGGDHTWSEPVLGDDGVYVPGAWTEPVDPKVCFRGYHLTTPEMTSQWFIARNSMAYLAEYRGKVDKLLYDSDGKIAVESCRLLRPLTVKELKSLRIFIEGKHTVWWGRWVEAGTSKVTPRGLAHVYGCRW